MATVRDLITSSLRLIGAIASEESATAAEAVDGLDVLNDIVDSWSLERLLILAVVRQEFTLAAGQQFRTLGVTGNFNTTRPIKIIRAGIVVPNSSNLELPVEIYDEKQWSEIAVKQTTSSIPLVIWPDNAFPLMNIGIWPVPDNSTNKLVLYTWKPLPQFATLDDVLALAPGFKRALRYALAVELSPEYGKQPAASIVELASMSKGAIKSANAVMPLLDTDPAVRSRSAVFNYLTGGS